MSVGRTRTMHHVGRIIEVLKQRGRATVAELAVELGLSPRYVRYELIQMAMIVAGGCIQFSSSQQQLEWVCR